MRVEKIIIIRVIIIFLEKGEKLLYIPNISNKKFPFIVIFVKDIKPST